jgi:hypothetical protein
MSRLPALTPAELPAQRSLKGDTPKDALPLHGGLLALNKKALAKSICRIINCATQIQFFDHIQSAERPGR